MRQIFLFIAALCCAVMVNAATAGALSGKFSVSATRQVVFSQGNLQYHCTNHTWQFAAEQFEYLGAENANISNAYDGWIDLFGWGTGNAPTTVSEDPNDYSTFTDWGTNAISNGGNEANLWRTLTHDEWVYLFCGRTDAKDLFTTCTIDGVRGVIVLPDDWTGSRFSTGSYLIYNSETNSYGNDFGKNFISGPTFSASDWADLETNGAVFFPAGGDRLGTNINQPNDDGAYWSSTPHAVKPDTAYSMGYNGYNFNTNYDLNRPNGARQYGVSVRLVQNVPAVGDTIQYTYKGQTLLYKIQYKTSTVKEVYIVNDGWNKVSKPNGALVIPDSVEDWQGTKYAVNAIYVRTFMDCTGLTSVDFSDNKKMTVVGEGVFQGCTALASVTLSNYITELWPYCFSGCALSAIDLRNVSYIDSPNNFYGSNIATVNIPKSLTSIPDQTYLFDHAITITCDAENTGLVAENNVLYNKSKTKLIALPLGSTDAIHLPATVTSFSYCCTAKFAGTLYINSQMEPDWNGGYDSNSPTGDVVVGCGLLDFYTTGKYTNPNGVFANVHSLTEELLWEVTLTQTAGGTIAFDGTPDCSGATVAATPASGYKFVKWSDDSTDNPHTFTITADTEISAVFAEDSGTAIDTVTGNPSPVTEKVLRNGQLLIIRDGKTYNTLGTEVK